ncbi:hypothetical protein EV421DRAFT_242033 [Armillaria borealis]|uniref:Uncharacterized protein n=1 Tax=Armillaria borealis TaxID=47425 RepID=A0AA39MEF0_9AGAR|nr:hypothetical protein EV421DRAFT_242033 [Armillaria borealis]
MPVPFQGGKSIRVPKPASFVRLKSCFICSDPAGDRFQVLDLHLKRVQTKCHNILRSCLSVSCMHTRNVSASARVGFVQSSIGGLVFAFWMLYNQDCTFSLSPPGHSSEYVSQLTISKNLTEMIHAITWAGVYIAVALTWIHPDKFT